MAVALFLEEKITLPQLFSVVEEATLKPNYPECDSLDSVYEADSLSRRFVREYFGV